MKHATEWEDVTHSDKVDTHIAFEGKNGRAVKEDFRTIELKEIML